MEKITVKKEYFSLLKSLIDKISVEPGIEINGLTQELLAEGYNKEIIHESIYYMISQDFIEITESKKKFGKIKIKLHEKPELCLKEEKITSDYPKLLINFPAFNIFGMKSELEQANISYFNMKEEFRNLFANAKSSIYICSPFLQMNGFNDFINVLISKAKEGVDIKIVARQIDKKDINNRYEELNEIYQIFKEKKAKISIRNYHYQKRGVESSTHANLIVCDNKYAYIGSGEFRTPSFEKNFEVGIIIKDEVAQKIGIIYEKLFSVSNEMEFD